VEEVPLSVPAPGVLGNDPNGGAVLTTVLVSGPTNGTLTLNTNGAFLYTPGANFVGEDSFSYRASFGTGDLSGPAAVSIIVTPSGSLFADTFPGTNLSPWTVEEGTWTVANGVLNGSSTVNNLGYAYIGTNWTNYAVQASVRFSMTNGPWGGGIGGRLNAATGAHYAAWVYPEGSQGGSSIMNLIKWETWGNWSGTPMAQAKLPGVGTNWHTVTLDFHGSNITAWYDGTREISATDNNFSAMAPLASGGITADLYTSPKPFTFSVENVVVSDNTPLAVADSYNVAVGATLTVAAPGVLGNDTGGSGSLTALLVSGPTNGTLTLNADGAFVYTPRTSFVGEDSFSYEASDELGDLSAPALVSISVILPGTLFTDTFPGTSLSPWTVEEGSWLVANGVLNGSSTLNNLGYAYIGTNWTNYTVQASVRFSMTNGSWGGGIGGRLNAATGAHYAAWVYPEGSQGGSSIMNLIKWETWSNWSRTPMAQAKLPGVGTNWHTVTLSFQGSNITASYDGTQEISLTDDNFSAMAPLASGGITADLYTSTKPFTFSVEDVVVNLDSNASAAQEERLTLSKTSATKPAGFSSTHAKAIAIPAGVEIEHVAVSPGGQAELALRGQPGQSYLLERSEDLIHWQVLAAGSFASAHVVFVDQTVDQSGCRYYRVRAAR
jgi:GH24 family phage-related lysozyme (muramidase)